MAVISPQVKARQFQNLSEMLEFINTMDPAPTAILATGFNAASGSFYIIYQ